ncbi:MAG: hypothetical protein HYU55_12120 [Nocardioides sp.]|nr:hypothetical protein [Nocardioides sp.]
MHVTTLVRPTPRPQLAVEPVAGAVPGERRDAGRQGHRGHRGNPGHQEPIVVHVPMPRGPSDRSSAIRDAYRLERDRPAVDLYL